MRKFIKRGAIAAAVLAAAVYTSSFFVRSEIERGSGAYLSAAQLDSLAGLLGDVNAVVWPKFPSDPYSCNGNATGGYYFNTTANEFRTCDGSSWSPNGGGVASLTNFDDVSLSSPADNDVLRYRSTPGLWGNSAAASFDLDGLSDVVITDPEPLEILTYTGSNWENSGNSPTTLAGLTDTTITTPVAGDHLVHDGADWKNETGFEGIPYFLYADNVSGSGVSNQECIDGSNQIGLYRILLEFEIEVDNIVWFQNAKLSESCSCQGVAIYSADGNTLIGSARADGASLTVHNVDVDNFTIGPGEYWLAVTHPFAPFSGWCTFGTYSSNTIADQIRNNESTQLGKATNTSVDCAFPPTTGTIIADTNEHRPIILIEGR